MFGPGDEDDLGRDRSTRGTWRSEWLLRSCQKGGHRGESEDGGLRARQLQVFVLNVPWCDERLERLCLARVRANRGAVGRVRESRVDWGGRASVKQTDWEEECG